MAVVSPSKEIREILDRKFNASIFSEAAALGRAIPDSHIELINRWTRREYAADELYTFPVLAIDDQMTRNYVQYTSETQRATVKAWIGIPFLFNKEGVGQNVFTNADHDLKASSQFARIYEAKLVRTPQNTVGTLVWVYTVRGATQEIDDFINKIDAGILREVSIHVMATDLICAIDGDKWPCPSEHMPGEAYDGEICFLKTKGPAEPLELSSVACPGSLVAHVMPDENVGQYTTLKEALGGSLKNLEAIMSDELKKKLREEDPSGGGGGGKRGKGGKGEKPGSGTSDGEGGDGHEDPKAGTEKPAGSTEADKMNDGDEDDREEATGVGDGPTDADDDDDKDVKGRKQSRTGGAKKMGADDEDDGPEGDAGGAEAQVPAAFDAQAFKLFEGHCPACGRDGEVKETVVTMDEGKFKEALDAIRATSAKTIEEIKSKAAEAVKQNLEDAEMGRKIMADMRAECVKLAVDRGIKSDSDAKAYAEEVAALDYSAVRLLRETLMKAEKPASREEQRKLLAVDAKTRWNEVNGINTETDEKGRTRTKESRKPRLATNIGPAKEKE